MITFEGYAVERYGKFLGYEKRGNKLISDVRFYKRPKFPVVGATEDPLRERYARIGRIVRVKITMEIDETGGAK